MEYVVLFWILTILGSIALDLANGINIIKDMVDNGYKLNLDNRESEDIINHTNIKTLLLYLIPFVNIIESFRKTTKYLVEKEELMEEIKHTEEKINDKVYEEYKKNPSTFKALSLSLKSEENDYINITYNNTNEKPMTLTKKLK